MSMERRRLQPWFTREMNLHGWLCWKLEDKNRPGLPDTIVRSPRGRTSWVELKWSRHSTTVAVHLAPTQWRHFCEWEDRIHDADNLNPSAWVLVAAPAFNKIFLIPRLALRSARQTFRADELERLPGVETCACSRADLGELCRLVLGP